jgi:hypothetical protein
MDERDDGVVGVARRECCRRICVRARRICVSGLVREWSGPSVIVGALVIAPGNGLIRRLPILTHGIQSARQHAY